MKTGGEKNKDLHAHVHMKTKQNKTKTLTCPHNVQESSYPYIYCRLFLCVHGKEKKRKSPVITTSKIQILHYWEREKKIIKCLKQIISLVDVIITFLKECQLLEAQVHTFATHNNLLFTGNIYSFTSTQISRMWLEILAYFWQQLR